MAHFVWKIFSLLKHSHPILYPFSTFPPQKIIFLLYLSTFIQHLLSHSLFYNTLY